VFLVNSVDILQGSNMSEETGYSFSFFLIIEPRHYIFLDIPSLSIYIAAS